METPPEVFTGSAILIFPSDFNESNLIPGWAMRIKDAITGKPIETVTMFKLHGDAQSFLWAEFTMFVDEEGKPVESGQLVPLFGTPGCAAPRTDTFPFLITGAEVAPLAPEVSSVKEVSDGSQEV